MYNIYKKKTTHKILHQYKGHTSTRMQTGNPIVRLDQIYMQRQFSLSNFQKLIPSYIQHPELLLCTTSKYGLNTNIECTYSDMLFLSCTKGVSVSAVFKCTFEVYNRNHPYLQHWSPMQGHGHQFPKRQTAFRQSSCREAKWKLFHILQFLKAEIAFDDIEFLWEILGNTHTHTHTRLYTQDVSVQRLSRWMCNGCTLIA